MFWFRDTVHGEGDPGGPGREVRVAFTDASLDLQGTRAGFADALGALEQATGVPFVRLNQVHGTTVLSATRPGPPPPAPPGEVPEADGLVTTTPGLGLMVRVADCVPVVLVDADSGVVGAAHAGRVGMTRGVVGTTVAQMRAQGANRLRAFLGPRICGACYEVPQALRAEVAAEHPETWSETSWGTPALDVAAGVRRQLEDYDVTVTDVGGCTLEDDRLHSYRRSGAGSGRLAGLVWLEPRPDEIEEAPQMQVASTTESRR